MVPATTLNRDVAIKVLPEAFAREAERLARFTRDAQVLASLNHPIIATVHGIEEQVSIRALVMELVEGLHALRTVRAKNVGERSRFSSR